MNTPSNSPLTVRFFGVGNAGVNLLDCVAARALAGATGIAINTDAASLAASAASEKINLEAKTFAGLGTGGDPARGLELAEEMFGRLKSQCEGAQVVFIFAGLGGGCGSGAAPVLARAAKECGALVIGIVALPFEFEGKRRMQAARRAQDALREFADGVVCWPNQKVFKLVDENTAVADTLRGVNERVAVGVAGLWRLLTQRGLLNVQFADLCAVLRDSHQDALFGSAEAQGESRAAVAAEKLLAHPLLDGGDALNGANAVLVSISAGSNLTMAEVARVMDAVNSRCGEAKVFVGAAEDAALGGSLQITLVAARDGEPLAEEPAPVRAPRVKPESAGQGGHQLDTEFLERQPMRRTRSRYVAPKPDLSADEVERLAQRTSRGRKSARLRQTQLPLEIISKGRFEKSEPTVLHGQDLDVPTFVRRNMVFN